MKMRINIRVKHKDNRNNYKVVTVTILSVFEDKKKFKRVQIACVF